MPKKFGEFSVLDKNKPTKTYAPEVPSPIDKKAKPLKDFELTGEFRCPLEGEWIVGMTGYPRRVGLDYGTMKFHILRRKIQVVENENESQKKTSKGKNNTRKD